ncbi:MAG: protein kinase [Firmicutes bacterium]|nr:protein kinase [Bacillota bacterium]MCM1402132.1 protein kinase [Bacteroides sp.]MCM1477171.1 protein kinase [Bacteroides sp.]
MQEESGFFTSAPGVKGVHDDYHDFRLLYASGSGLCQVMTARRHGRTFVVKTLKPSYRGNPAAEAALRKEFEAGTMIDSPHVVRTIDFVSFPDYGNAIILEYCPGITLRTLLEDKGLINAPEIDSMVRNIAAALSDMHVAGLIHRDLKPENIIVSASTKSLKIIDLGFADSDEFYILRGPAGTKRYTPADRMQPDATADSRNDLYSFGIILSELSGSVTASRRRAIDKLSRQLTSGKITSANQIVPAYKHLTFQAKFEKALLWILPAALLAGAVIYFLSMPPKIAPNPAPAPHSVVDSVKTTPHSDSSKRITGLPAQAQKSDDKATEVPDESTAQTVVTQSADSMEDSLRQLIPDILPSDQEFLPNQYGVTLAEAKYLAIYRRNELDLYAVRQTDNCFTEAVVVVQSQAPLERRRQFYNLLLSEQQIAHKVMAKFRAKHPGADTIRALGLISQRYRWLRGSTSLPARPE